jgi:small subunit ribosomal protein S2
MSVSLQQLFNAKVHIGHRTQFCQPKMKPFILETAFDKTLSKIFGRKNRIHRINLQKTQTLLEEALAFLRELGGRRGSKVLMVATKSIAQPIIKEQAIRAGMPYVDQYWRGGTLTNYRVSRSSVKTLKDMYAEKEQGIFSSMTKKEIRRFETRLSHLEKGVGGIKDMVGLPDALFVIDVGCEKIAISEAKKLRIPIVGVVDTNDSPERIDCVIPGNDDAISAIQLYASLAADAILEGRRSLPETSSEAPQPIIKTVKRKISNLKPESKETNNIAFTGETSAAEVLVT